MVQQTKASAETTKNRQLWRFIPVDAECETDAPSVPTGLKAVGQSASIVLSWNKNEEDDMCGYTILRADREDGEWNTIARCVKGTEFVDNLCEEDVDYIYKIKAVDRTWNSSAFSDSVTVRTSGEKTLVMRLEFDGDLKDQSTNVLDGVHFGEPVYSSISALRRSGEKALILDGKKYVQLPYSVGNMRELTVCGWFYQRSNQAAWQRLFDFGNGTDQYMFVTPNSGSDMRFVIKNGGDEEIISMKKMSTTRWHHVAVTMSEEKVCVFVDGELMAESSDMKLRPSDIKPVMCYLGRSQFVSDPLFSGYADDFRIYNYPLSGEEIKVLVDEATGIVETRDESFDHSTDSWQAKAQEPGREYYNLSGQKVGNDYRGIVISNGKKILKVSSINSPNK